jgi:hypothetical protein
MSGRGNDAAVLCGIRNGIREYLFGRHCLLAANKRRLWKILGIALPTGLVSRVSTRILLADKALLLTDAKVVGTDYR